MKKILIPMMAAALVTGFSGLAKAEDGSEEAAHVASEEAPAEKAPSKKAKAKKAKGKHAKKGKSGCSSGNGCHTEEKAAPAAAAPAADDGHGH